MVSRVRVVDSAKVEAEVRLEVAAVAQTADGLSVKMHDKHGPLVSIGSVRGTRNGSGRIRVSGKRRESVRPRDLLHDRTPKHIGRKSVGYGQSVDLGGRRIIKRKNCEGSRSHRTVA